MSNQQNNLYPLQYRLYNVIPARYQVFRTLPNTTVVSEVLAEFQATEAGEYEAKRWITCVNACANIPNPEAIPEVVAALKIALRLIPNARGSEIARLHGQIFELTNHEKQLDADIKTITEAMNKLQGN